jgi:hypothetical protein
MKPLNTLVALLLFTALVNQSHAQVTYTTSKQNSHDVEVVHLVVTPAAESVPAFKNRLVSRDIDLVAGNAAPYYYRALLQAKSSNEIVHKHFGDDYDNWWSSGKDGTAIAKLPLDKVRQADSICDGVIRDYLQDAVRRFDCDWGLNVDQLRGPKIFSFLLPEFQDSRQLGRILALRTRLAIVDHRYDDAIASMRMSYRLGHDVARVPFIVCGLIGIAIDSTANGTLTDLIAAPNSPNMYWALTELRTPVIDLRPAMRFEMDFGPRIFSFLKDAETTDRSSAEWNLLFTQACRDLEHIGGLKALGPPKDKEDVAAGIAATGLGLCGYSYAKDQLIAQGMDKARVEQMAVGQVMAIYTARLNQRFVDDAEKISYLPNADARRAQDALDKQLFAATFMGSGEHREVFPFVSYLLPAVIRTLDAQWRLDRDVALLRTIEALRMYAASHDGHLPEQLEDIREVPVPPNPITGKAFSYRLENDIATLEPADHLSGGNTRCEIEIAAKK